ncbi:73_t:CDS:2, partial [Entrophospora sp. SA101]
MIDDQENFDTSPQNKWKVLLIERLPSEVIPLKDTESFKIEFLAEYSKSSTPGPKKTAYYLKNPSREPAPEPITEPELIIYKDDQLERMYEDARCCLEEFNNDPDDFVNKEEVDCMQVLEVLRKLADESSDESCKQHLLTLQDMEK